MATCKSNKIDSNVTGLRFAEEECLKLLPTAPKWYALEPNSYSDFGGQISTIARNPINPSRQQKKGVTTDLEASGGFNQDLTFSNTTRLLQGFFFADIRERGATAGMNAVAPVVISEMSSTQIKGASALATSFPKGSLILTEGFGKATNNGLKYVSEASDTDLTIDGGLEVDTELSKATIKQVGYRFEAGTVSMKLNSKLAYIEATATLPTLGFIPGEWVFLGSDSTTGAFKKNTGFARISRVTDTTIEFDKTSWTPEVEEGTDLSIEVYFGDILRSEHEYEKIKRRTYQLERVLGNDSDGQMSEYLVGAVPNEFTLNIAQADKVSADMSFVATDAEQRTGKVGPKAGTRVEPLTESAFNTSSDFSRIKLSLVNEEDSAPTPLFAFATELSLSINNNVSANKAVGVLGAFDTSAGTFEVSGSLTAYFADVQAAQAVRNNSDVTLDIIMSKPNKALLWDIPLLSLGDGRLNIEQDQAITIPLELNAAQSRFGHTLLFQSFAYLPNSAN